MASTPEPVAEQHALLHDAAGATAPGHVLRALEWRTGLEYLAARLAMRRIARWPHGDGHPVLVMPGFLAGPSSTELLRNVLRHLGYRVYDWGLGYNLGYRASMKETLPARLRHIREQSGGRRVSLIGWSAGGIYARELARASPDDVRSVITLGPRSGATIRPAPHGGCGGWSTAAPMPPSPSPMLRWCAAHNRCRCRRPASTANRMASWPGNAVSAFLRPIRRTSRCAAAISGTATTCRRCR